MTEYPLADAKARFSEIVARAEAGETVTITRRGKPVAKLVPLEAKARPFTVEFLQSLGVGKPGSPSVIEELRASERY
jgi:prevent-host-death family protein